MLTFNLKFIICGNNNSKPNSFENSKIKRVFDVSRRMTPFSLEPSVGIWPPNGASLTNINGEVFLLSCQIFNAFTINWGQYTPICSYLFIAWYLIKCYIYSVLMWVLSLHLETRVQNLQNLYDCYFVIFW